MLLTHGKTDDPASLAEIKASADMKKGTRQALTSELRRLGWFSGKRRCEIADELEQMDIEEAA